MSNGVAFPGEVESTQVTPMLAALASILRHGQFAIEDVEAIAAVVRDPSVDDGTRGLARGSLAWLMLQSERGYAATWSRHSDALH